ncbi:MAG TPA: hypothetical protein VFR09_05100 [Alphaproteobacteria bacterium]|nr:hypothetical protein [Alphaproteobacteria bacterium]
MGKITSTPRSHFLKFLIVAALIIAAAIAPERTIANDLPLAATSPLVGFTFDDKPLTLPVQRNFQMAMLTASSELGRSCGKMESYGWRMNQSEQDRVNQIFNTTVDRLRGLGYEVQAQSPSSVSRDITMFTADRSDGHFIFMWSAGEIGLVMVLCQSSAPPGKPHANTLATTSPVQIFPQENFMQQTLPPPPDNKKQKIAASRFTPVGNWYGSYTCAQGYTGATLQISNLRGEDFEGVFRFYPTPKNPYVPSGRYTVYGQYDRSSNRILINPGKWLERPKNYYNTVMVGSFDPVQHTFSAYFQGITGCTSFEAKNTDESPAGMSGQLHKAKKKPKPKKKKVVKKAVEAAPVSTTSTTSTTTTTTTTAPSTDAATGTPAGVASPAEVAPATPAVGTAAAPASNALPANAPQIVPAPPAVSPDAAAPAGIQLPAPPPAATSVPAPPATTAPTSIAPAAPAATPAAAPAAAPAATPAPAAAPASPSKPSGAIDPDPTHQIQVAAYHNPAWGGGGRMPTAPPAPSATAPATPAPSDTAAPNKEDDSSSILDVFKSKKKAPDAAPASPAPAQQTAPVGTQKSDSIDPASSQEIQVADMKGRPSPPMTPPPPPNPTPNADPSSSASQPAGDSSSSVFDFLRKKKKETSPDATPQPAPVGTQKSGSAEPESLPAPFMVAVASGQWVTPYIPQAQQPNVITPTVPPVSPAPQASQPTYAAPYPNQVPTITQAQQPVPTPPPNYVSPNDSNVPEVVQAPPPNYVQPPVQQPPYIQQVPPPNYVPDNGRPNGTPP